jgi:hypothetical protein
MTFGAMWNASDSSGRRWLEEKSADASTAPH